jgi:hypothetical protein
LWIRRRRGAQRAAIGHFLFLNKGVNGLRPASLSCLSGTAEAAPLQGLLGKLGAQFGTTYRAAYSSNDGA